MTVEMKSRIQHSTTNDGLIVADLAGQRIRQVTPHTDGGYLHIYRGQPVRIDHRDVATYYSGMDTVHTAASPAFIR